MYAAHQKLVQEVAKICKRFGITESNRVFETPVSPDYKLVSLWSIEPTDYKATDQPATNSKLTIKRQPIITEEQESINIPIAVEIYEQDDSLQ